MEYESEQRGYDDEPRGYERDRSRSPRGDRRELDDSRARSASPNGRDTRGALPIPNRLTDEEDEEGARNPGSNLFVTGIHPNLSEEEVTRLFEKYGEVEKCNIMRDPHSKESRGFGFVKMVTPEQADAAKEGLQGEVHQGRTLSIEKARRSRPRIPTPGKYYGPPKREFGGGRGGGRGGRGGGGRFGDRYGDRYDDRYDDRRGGGGYSGRREEYSGGGYRGSRYNDREDRGYRRDREDYGSRGVDRYASREDRGYRGGGEDRRGGGGGGYYDRPPPPAGGSSGGGGGGGGGGYDAPPPRQDAGYSGGGGSGGGGSGGRSYDDRG